MKNKTLVFYHFYEKNQSYIDNFLHFFLFGYSESLDYIVVIAGKHTIELPEFENVTYIFAENKNNDFGGYAYAIHHAVEIKSYEYFVFVNASVRGPYTPSYCDKLWTEYFIDKLKDDTVLVGSTINIMAPAYRYTKSYKAKFGGQAPFSHVQTMAYALTQEAILFLYETGFYNLEEVLSKEGVIESYEIHLSQTLIRNGWNIQCLLPEYNEIDYRLPHRDINPTSRDGDPSFKKAYFGRTAHPFEILFVKTNRRIFSFNYLNRLSYSSYKTWKRFNRAVLHPSILGYVSKLESVATSGNRLSWLFLR